MAGQKRTLLVTDARLMRKVSAKLELYRSANIMGRKKAAKRDSIYKEHADGVQLDLSMQSIDTVSVIDLALLPFSTSVDLSINKLTTLPDNFPTLDHLVVLDLSKNQLTALPDTFGQLTSLKKLDLVGNELRRLPYSFAELKKLQWLDLKDNPWQAGLVDVAIVAQSDSNSEKEAKACAQRVLKYVSSKAKEKAKKDAYKQRLEARKHEEEEARRLAAEEEARAEKRRLKAILKEERRRLLVEQGVIPDTSTANQNKATSRQNGMEEEGGDDDDDDDVSQSSGSGTAIALVLLVVLGVLGALVAQHLGMVDLTLYTSYILDWISSLDGVVTMF
eukprot:m.72897 g.72897  ORF g.72897 m.72897 type:complete len:333 (+) comp14291_c0_seq1:715-1713(+)